MPKAPDFTARHTATTLAEFATMFTNHPYVVYKGVRFAPFYIGVPGGRSDVPAYRYHPMPLSRWRDGEIVCADANGKAFRTGKQRDADALARAGRLNPTRRGSKHALNGP